MREMRLSASELMAIIDFNENEIKRIKEYLYHSNTEYAIKVIQFRKLQIHWATILIDKCNLDYNMPNIDEEIKALKIKIEDHIAEDN